MIRKGDRYTLTEDEVIAIKALARGRTKANRSKEVRDAGIGPKSGLYKDILGAGGEWAFARLAGCAFDYSLAPRSHQRGEDEASDTVLDGHVIDVKTTDYRTGRLVVAPWHGESEAIYALMVLIERTPPTFEFKGFAERVTAALNLTDLGHGPTFAVPQKQLLDWEDLLGTSRG